MHWLTSNLGTFLGLTLSYWVVWFVLDWANDNCIIQIYENRTKGIEPTTFLRVLLKMVACMLIVLRIVTVIFTILFWLSLIWQPWGTYFNHGLI